MSVRFSTGLRDRLWGLTYNKVSNGEFTSATTGWTAVTADLSSVASGQSGNCLQVAESGGAAAGKAYQDVTVSEDKLLHLSFYFKKGTADGGRVFVGDGSTEDAYYDSGALTDAAWTQYDAWFVIPAAAGSTARITLQSTDATAGETSLFDTVVLEHVEAGLRETLKHGRIRVYTGSQPTTADSAVQGTLLGEVTDSHGTVTDYEAANGLDLDTPDAATISNDSTETWQFVGLTDGTAGWGRWVGNELDAGAASTVLPRIDFSIGSVGADVTVSPSPAVATGGVYSIDSMQILLPYQAGATT
jgi:hypothetical protein